MRLDRHAVVMGVLAAWVAVAGCAHTAPATPQSSATAPTAGARDDADALVRFALRYWQYLQTLPPPAFAAEFARVDTAQRRHTEDLHARVQLALLRALPRTPFYDSAGALALIDGSLDTLPTRADESDGAASAVEDLLWFMRSFVQEQRNADQRAQAQARLSRELRSQLEQLKSIERSLENRAAPNALPAPNGAPAQGAP